MGTHISKGELEVSLMPNTKLSEHSEEYRSGYMDTGTDGCKLPSLLTNDSGQYQLTVCSLCRNGVTDERICIGRNI